MAMMRSERGQQLNLSRRKRASLRFAYRDRTYDFSLVQHGDGDRSSPIPGQSQLVAVLRISKHIGHMSDSAVQYCAPGR